MALPSPAPTDPPDPRVVAHRLQARSLTPTTCGYISGSFASPVTCEEGLFCAADPTRNVHDCCLIPGQCIPPTTCIDSTVALSDCNATCQADSSTLKCTRSIDTYCYTLFWTDGMSQYGCTTSPFTARDVQAPPNGTVPTGTGSTTSVSLPNDTTSIGSPTDSSTASASTSLKLSTAEIVGIAVGGCIVLLAFVIIPIRNNIKRCLHERKVNRPQSFNPPPRQELDRMQRRGSEGRPPSLTPGDSVSVVGLDHQSSGATYSQVAPPQWIHQPTFPHSNTPSQAGVPPWNQSQASQSGIHSNSPPPYEQGSPNNAPTVLSWAPSSRQTHSPY